MLNIGKISKTLVDRHSIILGITAVLLLELGFTGVLSSNEITERSDAVIAQAGDHGAELPVGDLQHASILPEDLIVNTAPADDAEPKAVRTRRTVVTADRGVRRVSYRSPSHASTARSRKPVTKLKPHSLMARTPNDDLDRDMDDLKEIKPAVRKEVGKRSFASTTVSMIRKPYSWIKALGSRIF